MDVRTLQTELKARGLYGFSLDNDYGPRTDRAVEAYLLNQRVKGFEAWGDARQTIAAQQAVARERGIEVGDIDGRIGTMTRHAFEVYDARAKNGWKPVPAVEDWRGATDETTKPVEPSHPLPAAPKIAGPRVNSPRQSGVSDFYGEVGSHQATLTIPFPMRLAWEMDTVVRKFSCHEKVREALEYVWKETLDHYGIDEVRRLRLDLYGGCLNVRKMRGGSSWSMHSWGIAWDVDPDHNQLKWGADKATLDDPVYDYYWSLVYATGAISLGRERNYDFMHGQYARL